MRPVRFVHAADLHLDAPFAGVEASDARVRAELVASTFEAFDRIVGLCLDEDVDFLVIAGDVYDVSRSMAAQMRFQQQMRRLADAGIPVLISRGNHDPADGWSAGLELPECVHHFSAREVEAVPIVRDGETLCTVYGRSYEHASEARNLAQGFSRTSAGGIAIGVLHTNVGVREGVENYAPCSLDDLRAAGMDYWALGHIHKPEVLSESPAIVYAGCPQGRSPKEDGVRGCYLVEVEPGRAQARFIPVCSIVWERLTVDVTGAAGIEAVRAAVRAACEDARSRSEGRPVIVRLDMTGRTDARAVLVRGTVVEDLLADARDEQLAGTPWVWVDRLVDRTSGVLDIDEVRLAQDFAGDLVRLADEIAADPTTLQSMLAEALASIESALGTQEQLLTSAQLLERARDVCLERLEGEAS